MLKLRDFDFDLPKELIAQFPVSPRDHSRLLILERNVKEAKPLRPAGRSGLASLVEHKLFYDIIDYLKKGDVLVLNNSRVFPARLTGKRKETGGKVEVFLLQKINPPAPLYQGGEGGHEVWQCLVGGHQRKENLEVEFQRGLTARVIKNNGDGTWHVAFNKKGKALTNAVYRIGHVPLPPYIKRKLEVKSKKLEVADKVCYQTVYARNDKIGSVAAPTAGLHFTKRLLKEIKAKGVKIVYVTLHVGLGTFAPVKVENIAKHKMHAEWVEVKASALREIWQAKSKRKCIFAVGTTSVRTLEALAKFPIFPGRETGNFEFSDKSKIQNFNFKNFNDWVNIFIYPGYKFKVVDAVITNFHLPKSTLLMLVSAFANTEAIKKAYGEAIKKKYRFYSYGDAMLII